MNVTKISRFGLAGLSAANPYCTRCASTYTRALIARMQGLDVTADVEAIQKGWDT
jgi:hypothetical protein